MIKEKKNVSSKRRPQKEQKAPCSEEAERSIQKSLGGPTVLSAGFSYVTEWYKNIVQLHFGYFQTIL
jgi:hypothetical protein